MKTIDKLIDEHYALDKDEDGNKVMYFWQIKDLLLDYGKEVLKEAANKATLGHNRVLWDDPKEGEDAYMNIPCVDKDSILNIINELK